MSDEIAHEGSRSATTFVVAITVVVVSFFTVSLRLVSRLAILRRVTFDDLFIVLAWLLALGISIAICLGTRFGLGKHDQDIPLEWRGRLNRSQYVVTVLLNPALIATKTSILIFYLRLTKVTQKFFRLVTLTTLVVVNVVGCVLTILHIIQCLPIDATFQYPQPTRAKCIGILNLSLASAPVNIITDLAILFLPLPIFTSLRMPQKQKIALLFVFTTGASVTVIDVLRIAYLQEASQIGLHWANLDNTAPSNNMVDQDFFWYASQYFMWSTIEVNTGIICACIPTLKPAISWAATYLRSGTRFSRRKLHSPSGQHYEMNEHEFVSGGQEPSHNAVVEGRDKYQVDFITTPEMGILPPSLPTEINSDIERLRNVTYFDFVGSPCLESIIAMSSKKSIRPLAIANTIFLVLGFAEGNLLDLNCNFEMLSNMSNIQPRITYTMYFCGYLIAPLTFGSIILRRYSFKATIITGLCIYSCGVLVFWPSAVLGSVPAFIISNLIVGMGIAMLELGMIPFVTLCGPAEYAESRLNFLYFVRGLGNTAALAFIRQRIFGQLNNSRSIINTQWEYLGLALLCIVSMLVLYYLPLPEASNEDLESHSSRWSSAGAPRIGSVSVIYITLAAGIFTQLSYKSAETSIGLIHESYADVTNQIISQACLTAGRFGAAIAMTLLKPRHILAFFGLGSIITALVATRLPMAGLQIDTMLTYFFISAIYPTSIGISLRHLGSHIKIASVMLVAASSSSAIIPLTLAYLIDNSTSRHAWFLTFGLLSAAFMFPLYLNLTPAARKQVDPEKSNIPPPPPSEPDASLSAG